MKNIAWIALIPQFCIFLLLVFIFNQTGVNDPGLIAFFVFMAISILLRHIPAAHRKAVTAYRKGEFNEAIRQFNDSYNFFSRHAWLDRTRYLTLLNASKMSYREMALLNTAYCYGKLGKREKMRAYIEQTLQEFPKSKQAREAISIMDEEE